MANHVRLYVRDAPTIVSDVVTEGVNKPIELIRSVVEKNGTRAVDTGVFTISRKFKIDKGDKLSKLFTMIKP